VKYQLSEIAEALGASTELVGTVTGVTTDSRSVKPGDLFVAIIGEQFDGHEFVSQAFAQGAVAAVVQRDTGGSVIKVSDTLLGLGQIARFHRTHLKAQVIGVTGSSGKTSTKDLLAQVLENFGTTIAPPGSFNNEIGLPNTILSATSETEFLVLEMGMRGVGHIDYLCNIASPDIGVVLNVGSAHMELLGSRETIAEAKSELISSLKPTGVAILLADDPLVAAMQQKAPAHFLTFGESAKSDIRISDLHVDAHARPTFTVSHLHERHIVHLRLVGEHQALNAAAVIATCVGMGLEFSEVCSVIERVTNLSKWRMEVTELPNNITIVNDAYNANPESMRAGLKALKALSDGRRSWAVLGEMRELGADAASAHDEIGRLVVRLDVSRLLAVGPGAKLIQMAASHEGSWGDESEYVDSVDEAVSVLLAQLESGDVVFIKGSRAVGLERVAQALIAALTRENSTS